MATAIVDSMAEGESPTEALIKYAQSESLTPDQIRLVSNQINIALVNTQRTESKSILDKFAHQELCDPVAVIQAIVGPAVTKTASRDRARLCLVGSPAQEKCASASATSPAPGTDEPLPCWIAPNNYSEADKIDVIFGMRHHVNSKAAAVSAASIDLRASKLRLEKLIKTATVDELVEAAHRAPKLADWLGGAVTNALPDRAQARYKTAAAEKTWRPVTDTGTAVIAALEEVEQAAEKYAAAREDYGFHSLIARKCVQMIRTTTPMYKSATLIPTQQVTEEAARQASLEKFADALSGALGAMYGRTYGKSTEPDFDSANYRLAQLQVNDPEHQSRLDRIKLRATLQELIETDPVVSGADPAEVVTAFNRLAQSTPHLVSKPLLLGPAMRRVLYGDMANFDAQQLLDAEKTINQSDARTPQNGY